MCPGQQVLAAPNPSVNSCQPMPGSSLPWPPYAHTSSQPIPTQLGLSEKLQTSRSPPQVGNQNINDQSWYCPHKSRVELPKKCQKPPVFQTAVQAPQPGSFGQKQELYISVRVQCFKPTNKKTSSGKNLVQSISSLNRASVNSVLCSLICTRIVSLRIQSFLVLSCHHFR